MGSPGNQDGSGLFRAVLIDDNPGDCRAFRKLILRHPSVRLCGEYDTLSAALDRMNGERIDLLFLSTRLAGKSIFPECARIPSSARMIFLARDGEDALRAFEADALDYLVKPLVAARLGETVRRLLRLEWARKPLIRASDTSSLLIPFERGRRGVALSEISVIQAFGNYTRVRLSNGKSEIVLRSLAKWESLLPTKSFLRVHRNSVVQATKIQMLEESSSGFVVRMKDDSEPVPVSRRCLPELRRAIFSSQSEILRASPAQTTNDAG